MLAALGNGSDNSVSECFPAVAAMAESLMSTHAEAGVQQEHALLGPTCEVATNGNGSACLRLYLLQDIAQ